MTPEWQAAVGEARAKVVTICGSTKFKDEIRRAGAELTMAGNLVIGIEVFGHTDTPDVEGTPAFAQIERMLKALHRQKIDLADEILVVNVNGYIGEGTRDEIDYAESHGKPVRYWEAALDPGFLWHRPTELKGRRCS